MPVEKTDAMGNVRVGKWRLVTDHSYPASEAEGGQLGASDTRTPKLHHLRQYRPTAEQVSRMSLECSVKYPGVGQRCFKHDIEVAYNLIDVRASNTKLFGVLLVDSIDGSVWWAVQTTCDFGFKGASGIYYANVALGIDAFHGLHKPSNVHINGPASFRSTTYGDDTKVCESDVGPRPWISDDCAKTGIWVAAGSGALSLVKYGEDGAIRSTVSGIGLTWCLNEGIVMVSETRVLKTGERWNNT